MANISFDQMNLDESLLNALKAIDYTTPSPIQAAAIPVALTGIDIIGQAQTGTGKTAAFGIPMIQNITKSGRFTKGLVLCPTRELCIQVTNELKKLAAFHKNVSVHAIYGGDPIGPQIKALRNGVDIVIGTPGRVMDHIDRGTLQLDNLEILALDEADEMLNMGFREDLESILQSVPEERQTILFSATMPKAIMDITHLYQKNPQLIRVTPVQLTAVSVQQYYLDTDLKNRLKALIYLLSQDDFKQAIVFCNTKSKVDELSGELAAAQIKNDVLHGDLGQNKRNLILDKFRKGAFKVLIATDVAARGIDVPHVEKVFNYDIPFDPEYYVHRVGRTGRAGREGAAYSFLAGSRDKRLLRQIEDFSKTKIEKFKLPEASEIAAIESGKLKKQIEDNIAKGLDNYYFEMARNIIPEGASPIEALAALLTKIAPKQRLDWAQPSSPANEPFSGKRTDRNKSRTPGRGGRDRGFNDRNHNKSGFEKRKGNASKPFASKHDDDILIDNAPSLDDILSGLGISNADIARKPKSKGAPVQNVAPASKKRGRDSKKDNFFSGAKSNRKSRR